MFDIIVIGAGPAGYEVASLLSLGGKSVCIVDKSENQVGGTCLNEGCIPAKNFLETASYMKKSEYFQSCGVDISISGFDIEKLKHNTHNLIEDLKQGILSKLKKCGVQIKYGMASFINENSIKVNDEIISAKKIVIATGSSHKNHPLMNLHKDKIISSKEVFSLKHIPKSILIVGGGTIGCEFATFFNSFGCDVDIAEFTSRLVPIEDDDISRTIKREFEKKEIKVYLNANVTTCDIKENGVETTIDLGKKQEVKIYEKILISIGRIPNTSKLNLQNANIQEDRGFVEVNDKLQSLTNKNIYAIGDVINSPALAHVAYYEAKRVAAIILEKEAMKKDVIFPSVTFCSPQIASVGISEKALKERNINFKIKKLFFKSNGKAKIKGDDSGFVKIMYDESNGVILGAAIIGNDSTELIHEFVIAINANLCIDDLSKMIFAHPTLSESILDLVLAH